MSFRKRNVVIGTPNTTSSSPVARQDKTLAPGVRPSPLDGRLTTSSGTSSLDQLLAGHNGLPLGTSLLIQEAGTTDFGGTLLRYFSAEGLAQGHHVHVLGYGETWWRELPGLDADDKASKSSRKDTAADDRMKIAWRYEALGNSSPRNIPSRGMSSRVAHDIIARWLTRSLQKPHHLQTPRVVKETSAFVTLSTSPSAWRTATFKGSFTPLSSTVHGLSQASRHSSASWPILRPRPIVRLQTPFTG